MYHLRNRLFSTGFELRVTLSAGKKKLPGFMHIAGIAAALALAACASGGGGGGATSGGTTTGSTTGTAVGIPAPGSFGSSPVPAQYATSTGPTFFGANGVFPAPNTVFPILSSSLQVTSSGLMPVANPGATVTVVSSSATSSTFQVSVPSVGLSASMQITPTGAPPTSSLSYVALGNWQQQNTSGALTSFTEYVFGYQTPPASMPTTGTASFAGVAQGTVFTPGTTFVGTTVNGTAAFSVNFASGGITGALTQMQYVNPANPGTATAPNFLPWNDVSVTANIATGTNQFSGTTAVTSTTQSPLSLKSSATGLINGGFYGPSAQALAGIWSLNDGTNSVLGGVAANR